jgi:ABC-2 type transport system ATP-binding protein
MSDYAIEADSLVKVFRARWSRREVRAVDGITLRIPRGTTFGLLGPNGAGKTTFVKMLLSATHATAGSARVFGADCRLPEARRPVGYLPENHRFPTYFTGAGMLDLYGSLSGMDAAERKRRIPELLELVGLEKWGDVRLGKYSKGMLQRVGLAQAMLHRPRLLILDEPTDGVDPVGRVHIRGILQRLESEGVTIFLNSHLLVEVEAFCREVAIINLGRVVLTGNVKTLTQDKGYRLTVHALPEGLRAAMAARASNVASRNGFVDLRFATREQANEALDLLRANQVEIESMAPAANTLEEVFVRAVNG